MERKQIKTSLFEKVALNTWGIIDWPVMLLKRGPKGVYLNSQAKMIRYKRLLNKIERHGLSNENIFLDYIDYPCDRIATLLALKRVGAPKGYYKKVIEHWPIQWASLLDHYMGEPHIIVEGED